MNIKISDFAARYGVSDRHARRLLAEHETELCGHYTRNTKGTWIDEFAAEFLRDLLRNPMEILPAEPVVTIEDLQLENKKLKDDCMKLAVALADAEKRAGANAGDAKLLEAAKNEGKILQEKNEELIRENAKLEVRAEEAEGVNQALIDQADKAKAEAAELKQYTADVEAYFKLSPLKRLFAKPPKRQNKE